MAIHIFVAGEELITTDLNSILDETTKGYIPTADQKAALAGSGTPSGANKFVTADTDALKELLANKDTDGTLAANSDTKYPSQKAVKTYAENIANKDTDGTLAANSDTKYASQKATKTYADAIAKKQYYIVASANLKLSADAENSITGTSYVKRKEVVMAYSGYITVKFSLKTDLGNNTYGRIYINGVAVGSEQNCTDSSNFVEYSENFKVNDGDLIQLYVKQSASGTGLYKNFRIYFDKTIITEDGTVLTNS